MRHACLLAVLCFSIVGVPGWAASDSPATSVPGYHGGSARTGLYIAPGLTDQAATGVHPVVGFDGRVSGAVYAQPLYWQPPGSTHGMLIVATEQNEVDALDAATGKHVWRESLGPSVPRSALPCGDIDPVGVTGTPVLDPAHDAMFLDAMVDRGGTPEHEVFALGLTDGRVLPGWPVNVRRALADFRVPFTPQNQNQRAALVRLDGRVFVAFGGNWGDCRTYRGIVLGIDGASARPVAAWATRGEKGGIWAPGGIASDGRALFFTTGNTVPGPRWADGEAVIKTGPDLRTTDNPRSFFAPSDWRRLDEEDLDLSGVNPMLITLPGDRGATTLVLALGKDGNAYLLNRDDLGGVGGQIATLPAARSVIITAPATYPVQGRILVAYQAHRSACPHADDHGGLAAIAVSAPTRAGLSIAWCAPLDGHAAPVVTTTDGVANPIVWIAGAEGDDRLHAFRGEDGAPLFTSRQAIPRLRHFVTILVAGGRLYIAGDGQVHAFTWNPG